ncbi:MAG: hypothetical protein PUC41_03155 [Oscillospiraceae bacterium]|nr:hypothetical protein [Oscillospiraceae bacterium]
MDTLQSTVLAVCMVTVGLSFAEHLVNMERFGRQIRWLTVLLLMICMLRPWSSNLRSDASLWLPQTNEHQQAEELQAAADRLLLQSISAQLQQSLNAALREQNVNAQITAMDVHIAEDGSIDIKGLTVSGNLLTAAIYLREWVGDDITITATETED